jgi:hypothetical protein
MLVALGSAVATTIGWVTGTGLFGFLQQNPMAWVGLIQAYLLMTIIAVRSYWNPGSFETSSSMSEPSNALPRLRTL